MVQKEEDCRGEGKEVNASEYLKTATLELTVLVALVAL